jgi:hypothetical protein
MAAFDRKDTVAGSVSPAPLGPFPVPHLACHPETIRRGWVKDLNRCTTDQLMLRGRCPAPFRRCHPERREGSGFRSFAPLSLACHPETIRRGWVKDLNFHATRPTDGSRQMCRAGIHPDLLGRPASSLLPPRKRSTFPGVRRNTFWSRGKCAFCTPDGFAERGSCASFASRLPLPVRPARFAGASLQ